jgi:hypothetical protein
VTILERDDVVQLLVAAIREVRADLRDAPLSAATPLWSPAGEDAPSACELDSLDLLEVLVVLEEDHGLPLPEDHDSMAAPTIGEMADLLLGASVR